MSGKIPDWQNLTDNRPNENPRPEWLPRTGKVNVVAAQRRRLKRITARRNGKTARFGREHFPAENFAPQ
jgi:hypothetical protein